MVPKRFGVQIPTMGSIVIDVSGRVFAVPLECPCCGSEADNEKRFSFTRTTGKRVITETTRGFTFPYCTGCVEHSDRWNGASSWAKAITILGGVVAIYVAFMADLSMAALTFGLFLAPALGAYLWRRGQARALTTDRCVTPGDALEYLDWSGSISSFDFVSPFYAHVFARENLRKLVNASLAVRRLLDAPPSQQPTPPPVAALAPSVWPPAWPMADAALPAVSPSWAAQEPAVSPAPPVDSERDRALAWIARIESFKGPVARRNALRRALEEVRSPDAHRELVMAASRIELLAVLDKVDGLATPAAKRRHLEKAIADLKSDDVSDDLQAEELRQLEARLQLV